MTGEREINCETFTTLRVTSVGVILNPSAVLRINSVKDLISIELYILSTP